MSEIGYYNYYNNPHRYSPDTVQDRYQQMVDAYNSDKLKAKDSFSNPYSDLNISRKNLDEKLADWASTVRSQCKTEQEVHEYLSKKYFGTSDFAYTKRWDEPEKYAMFQNDYNAICYGTIGCGNLDDPRLNYSPEDWDNYENQNQIDKHKSISLNMQNLLKNNNINLSDDETLLISINPYTREVDLSGLENNANLTQLKTLLEQNNNSSNLLSYVKNQMTDLDSNSVAKMQAYRLVMDYTGLDLSKMETREDGMYYTSNGVELSEYLKEKLKYCNDVPFEFRGAAFEYTMQNVNKVAQLGWNNIPDLNISIGYNNANGFIPYGTSFEA